VVERVLVAQSPAAIELERAGLEREAVEQSALALFEAAQGFVPRSKAGRGTHRYTGQVFLDDVGVLTTGRANAVARVDLEIELAPEAEEEILRATGRAAEPLEDSPGALRQALERATDEALARAVKALAVELLERKKPLHALIADLSDREAAVREQAVGVLARRGDSRAVPALIAALHDSDPAVVERVVGALGELRDARAVPALIELARRRQGAYLASLARILGDIGGPDAKAWLLTMASGHPDETVRTAASKALAEMESREGAAR